jgi:hypothetical protein
MTWLSEKRAVEGTRVQKKNDPDERVWIIGDVYRQLPMTEDWVKDRRMAHERWRKVTDV